MKNKYFPVILFVRAPASMARAPEPYHTMGG